METIFSALQMVPLISVIIQMGLTILSSKAHFICLLELSLYDLDHFIHCLGLEADTIFYSSALTMSVFEGGWGVEHHMMNGA